MKPLKLLSLFSGIGAPERALENEGIPFELVAYCEIDKYAAKAYSLIHGVDESMNLGDITKVIPQDLPDFDLVFHGSPCFKAGTLVTTQRGQVPIEDIIPGDMALTHENHFKPVIRTGKKMSAKILKMRIMGSPVTYVTSNHPYFVRTANRVWDSVNKTNKREFTEPYWKQAGELTKGDFVGFPISTKESNVYGLSEEECWLLGRYVADGYIRNNERHGDDRVASYNHQIIFCIGKAKAESFLSNVNEHHVCSKEDRTAIKMVITDERLMNLCHMCGRGAENKEVPQFIIDLPNSLLSRFIDGYISGDGGRDGSGFKATTVSHKLAIGLQQAIHKLYHVPCQISFTERPKTTVIEGRTVNQKDTWTITFDTEVRKQTHAVLIDGIEWMPFREYTEENHDDFVYNLEVIDDHSYTANGCIVHNCQDFSVAGQQASGEKGSGTRSSLLWYTVEIVRVKRPRLVMWENVPNVLSEKHLPVFIEYLKALTELGYGSTFNTLNAKDFGVPQNRLRLFCISRLRDE